MMKPNRHDVLILFTRWPEPGRAKTRLIPALGAKGAADLHGRMTRQTAGRAWAFCAASGKRLVVVHEGGNAERMRDWLGPLSFEKQSVGDLGTRLTQAMLRAYSAGAKRVVIIGSDCPSLNETCLRAAFDRLETHDLVLLPVSDGGYALIGMSQSHPCLFQGVPWSTAGVTEATLLQAHRHRLSAALLEPLDDVDEPADLAHAETALAQGNTLSIIIPTLNEAVAIEALVPRLQAAKPHEILIADGGSTDGTTQAAARNGAKVVCSPSGRARQMNHAAQFANGEFLFFLHVDTTPPPNYSAIILRSLVPGIAAGAFRFGLRESIPLGSTIEALTRLRGFIRKKPYGDQGLFMRRSVFQAVGGFADWPILEDVDMVKRLRRVGLICITSEPAATSARRWQQDGVVRTFLRHQLILAGHRMGVPPERLVNWR
jgi:rSAM/selenodomain-associated transferase 2/rSAM/selenodomain-associated transferase 1